MVRDPLLLSIRRSEGQERLQFERIDQRRVLGDLIIKSFGAIRAIGDGDVASMAWRSRHGIEDAVDAQPSFGGTMTVRVSPTFMSSTASSKPGIWAPTPSVNCCGRAGKVCLVPSTCVIRNLHRWRRIGRRETWFDAATSVERRLAVDSHAQDIIKERLLAAPRCLAGTLDLDAEPQARLRRALAYRCGCGLGGR